MSKIALVTIALVVLLGLGYVATRPNPVQKAGQIATSTSAEFAWRFTNVGTDSSNGAPRTQVSLSVGTSSYPAGTYSGSCSAIENSTWALQENEKSGAICWFAGGGNEIGVFEEGGRLIVKLGVLDEGTDEAPAFRGDYRALFEIGEDARIATIYTRIDQGTSALGIKIVPLAVTEDSRCALDVQCIQAGTVKIKARVESDSEETSLTFELGKSALVGARRITLSGVEPLKMSQQNLAPANYRLTFLIETDSSAQ